MGKFLGGLLRSSWNYKAKALTKFGFYVGDIPDSAVEAIPLNYRYSDKDNKDLFLFVRMVRNRFLTEYITIGNKTIEDYTNHAQKGHCFKTVVKKYEITNIFRVSGEYRTTNKHNNSYNLKKIKPLEMTSNSHRDIHSKIEMENALKDGDIERYNELHESVLANKRSRRKFIMSEVYCDMRRQLKNRLQVYKTKKAEKFSVEEINILVARAYRQYADYVMGLNPSFLEKLPKDTWHSEDYDKVSHFLDSLSHAKRDLESTMVQLLKYKDDYYKKNLRTAKKDLYEIVKNF